MRIQLYTESADFHAKDLTEYQIKKNFTATDVLLSENLVILTVRDLWIKSYKDEEVLIEWSFAKPLPLKKV